MKERTVEGLKKNKKKKERKQLGEGKEVEDAEICRKKNLK